MLGKLLIILILDLSYIYQFKGLIHNKNFKNRYRQKISTILAAVDDATSYSLYTATIEFLGTNPSVLLELAIAPIIILANQFKTSKDIENMNTKYQQLEMSINKTNEELKSFPDDMKGAIEAYQVLYDSVNTKLTKISSNDIIRNDFERNIVKSIETINQMVTNEIGALRYDNNNVLKQQQVETDMKLNNLQSEYIELSKQFQNSEATVFMKNKDQFISQILQELTSIDSELYMKMRLLFNSKNDTLINTTSNENQPNNNIATVYHQNEGNSNDATLLSTTIPDIVFKIKQLNERISYTDAILSEQQLLLPNAAQTINVLKSQFDALETKLKSSLEQSKDFIDSMQQQNIDSIKQKLQQYDIQSNMKYDTTNKEVNKLLDKIKYFETLQEQLNKQQIVANNELKTSLSKIEEQSINKFETLETSLYEQSIRDGNVISSLNTSLQTALQDMIQFKEQIRNSNMELDEISEHIDGEQRQLSMRYKAVEEQISSISGDIINVVGDVNSFKRNVSALNESLVAGLTSVNSELIDLVTNTQYTQSSLSALEQSVMELSKESKQSIDKLKNITDKSIESLKTVMKNENEFLEGRVQMQISSLKKNTKNIEKDIVEKINAVDTSVETRIDNVLEYRSLPSRISRRVKNLSTGTRYIARMIKDNIKTTATNIRKKISTKSSTTVTIDLEQLILTDENKHIIIDEIES